MFFAVLQASGALREFALRTTAGARSTGTRAASVARSSRARAPTVAVGVTAFVTAIASWVIPARAVVTTAFAARTVLEPDRAAPAWTPAIARFATCIIVPAIPVLAIRPRVLATRAVATRAFTARTIVRAHRWPFAAIRPGLRATLCRNVSAILAAATALSAASGSRTLRIAPAAIGGTTPAPALEPSVFVFGQ